MKWFAILVPGLAVVLLAGLVAMANRQPAPAASGATGITIVATEMRFSPNRIDVRVGQPITITIVNQGNERHDLAFAAGSMRDLQGIETLTMPGATTRLTLTFDRAGTYPFLCTLPRHAVSGMTGAVFVKP